MVRSFWWSCRAPGEPPFDTAHLKVYYPAAPTWSDAERMSGYFPADTAGAPYPVVLILPGVNVGQDSYRKLAIALVEEGFAAVTYDYVAELFPGQYGISPGLDLNAVQPDTYGTTPVAAAVRSILDGLAEVNARGPVPGILDLDRVVLCGHSAGGTVTLQSGATRWFPELVAAISYGAHTEPAAVLGHPKGTVLPSPVDVPLLIMRGDGDGIMTASAIRYGEDPATRPNPVDRTFHEGLRDDIDAWHAVWHGCNHFLPGDEDPTCARGFLDSPPATDPAVGFAEFRALVADFLHAVVMRDPAAAARLAGRQDSGGGLVTLVHRASATDHSGF
jgi:dienelactone hydrolase